MFVRDSGNTPREISRIFVRDSLGNPQEISKIYVRDSSGNPVLVFNNNTTTVPDSICKNCDVGYVYYFNTPGRPINAPSGVGSSLNFSYKNLTQGMGYTTIPSPSTTFSLTASTIPIIPIDYYYWKKTSIPYNSIKTFNTNIGNTLTETQSTFYTTLEQNLACGTDPACFCNHHDRVFRLDGIFPEYWAKLIPAFNIVTNYPPLPGYIIVDYKTSNKKSTVTSILNRPQGIWDRHGANGLNPVSGQVLVPTGAYDQRFTPTTVAATRNSSIYPFYNRKVLFETNYGPNMTDNDITNMRCGQEYCIAYYGRSFYESWAYSDCWNWGYGGSQQYIEQQYIEAIANNPDTIPGTCQNDQQTGVWDTGQNPFSVSVMSNDGFGHNCKLFAGAETVTVGANTKLNPYTYIVYAENTATDRTLPTELSSADSNDCCENCFYGPIDDMCRQVFQIPPINSLKPLDSSTGLQFFRDISTVVSLNTEGDIETATAKVRYTLPIYVTLDSSLISKIVKMNNMTQAQIFQFMFSGPDEYNGEEIFALPSDSTLSVAEGSVWKALCDFTGFNIRNGSPIADQSRSKLSTTSFYYEENRFGYTTLFGETVPAGPLSIAFGSGTTVISKGITTATSAKDLGQFPLLQWNVSGYPTVNSTHYIVIELDFSGSGCVVSLLNEQNVFNNIRKLIRSISFYPIHFSCKNLTRSAPAAQGSTTLINQTSNFIHPSIIPSIYWIGNFDNIDYYRSTTNPTTTLTTDQGGSGVGRWENAYKNTISSTENFIDNFFVFIVQPQQTPQMMSPTEQANKFALHQYTGVTSGEPSFTYKRFLDYHYKSWVYDSTGTDGIP
jgi:hypothetical protein